MSFASPELEPVFVIPTIRLRDVPETVRRYDEHFHHMGRKIDIWIFDDSPFDLHETYYPSLQQTPTFNDVYMVGPSEKTQFLEYLMSRTGTTMANSIIARMFKPSYGGIEILPLSIRSAENSSVLTMICSPEDISSNSGRSFRKAKF